MGAFNSSVVGTVACTSMPTIEKLQEEICHKDGMIFQAPLNLHWSGVYLFTFEISCAPRSWHRILLISPIYSYCIWEYALRLKLIIAIKSVAHSFLVNVFLPINNGLIFSCPLSQPVWQEIKFLWFGKLFMHCVWKADYATCNWRKDFQISLKKSHP